MHNNRRGYPCYVSSSSLFPSPPCAWNVNSKPPNKAASKSIQGSWQVGSKWSGQQESTSTLSVLTLDIAPKRFQSTHNPYRRPWLRCSSTGRASMSSRTCTLLRFPGDSGPGYLKILFSQETPQLRRCFFFHIN